MLKRILTKFKNILLKIYFKILYGNRIKYGHKFCFRNGLIVQLSKEAHLKMGSHIFFNNYCSLNALNEIEIGNDCIFGENVKIYDHNHVFNSEKLFRESGYSVGKVKIGNNCWIGSNVTILKNAEIGDNCVIGAGCIINEKIENNTLVSMNRELIKEKNIKHKSFTFLS